MSFTFSAFLSKRNEGGFIYFIIIFPLSDFPETTLGLTRALENVVRQYNDNERVTDRPPPGGQTHFPHATLSTQFETENNNYNPPGSVIGFGIDENARNSYEIPLGFLVKMTAKN